MRAASLWLVLAVLTGGSAWVAAAEPVGRVSGSELRGKLESIVIPNLDLEEATIAQTVAFLRKRSQDLDPEGVGINIVLRLTPPPEKADPAAPAAPERTITLALAKVPLGQVIRYVCMAADLKFAVERDAVVIADRDMPTEEMETRIYRIQPGTMDTIVTKKGPHLKNNR